MIKSENGRTWSVRTEEEELSLLMDDINSLTPEQRETLMIALKELDDPALLSTREDKDSGAGPVRILDAISESEYKRPMVDLETFVYDPYYLGETCGSLHKPLLKDVKEIFRGGYQEILLTGSIGWGKCLAGDTIVFDAKTGSRRRIDEVGDLVVPSMCVSGDNRGKIDNRKATAMFSGNKLCTKIKLRDGSAVTASIDHKIYTSVGWVEAGRLKVGDLVATAREIPDPECTYNISDDEVKLIAYYMSDGGCTGGVKFTNAIDVVLDEYIELASSIGNDVNNIKNRHKNHRFRNTVSKPTKLSKPSKAVTLETTSMQWFASKYDCKKKSIHKQLPAELWGMSKHHISLFLNRFITCDGHINLDSRLIEITLGSEKLIDDIKFLLCRLGVRSVKRYKQASYVKDGVRRLFDSWRLNIGEADNVVKLFGHIGYIFGREKESRELVESFNDIRKCPNLDLVPVGYEEFKHIKNEIRKSGRKLYIKGVDSKLNCPPGQRLSYSKFNLICKEYGYKGEYAWLAQSDVVWVEVSNIEDVGVMPVYDLSVPDTHNFIANGVVVHNTYVASVIMCRFLYELSCLRDIHKTIGLAPSSDVTIVGISVNEQLAIRVCYENIATKIASSPYFKENFPFQETKKEFRFPNNVIVAALSTTDTSALGRNVIAALLDEGNFWEKIQRGKAAQLQYGDRDKVRVLYDQLVRRMKSRFMKSGKLPGKMVIASSKRTRDDFTNKRISESINDPSIYVIDYSTWDVKPEVFGKDRFNVLVGNETMPSRILDPAEVGQVKEQIKLTNDDTLVVVEVPEEYRPDFTNDIEGSIRDIAGRATVSVSPFIQQRDRIELCVDSDPEIIRKHPFSVESWDQSAPGTFIWELLSKRQVTRDGAQLVEDWSPIYYPHLPRHAHIDLSVSGDCTGMAIGCLVGYKPVNRTNKETMEIYVELSPVIWYDLLLRIVPPKGGEIDHGEVRGLIYQMQSHGFHISRLTMDQAQSASSMQKFRKRGLFVEHESVDRTIAPYDTLKAAIYEARVNMYRYAPALTELRTLQKDSIKNKVDHPRGGKKDVADCMAAVAFSLTTHASEAPIMPLKGISQHGDPEIEKDRAVVEDYFPPFIVG